VLMRLVWSGLKLVGGNRVELCIEVRGGRSDYQCHPLLTPAQCPSGQAAACLKVDLKIDSRAAQQSPQSPWI
jgi:hypothetical protein